MMKKNNHKLCFVHLGKTHDDLPIIVDKLKQRAITSVLLHMDDIDRFDFSDMDSICLRHCRGYHLLVDFLDRLEQLKSRVARIQHKSISLINHAVLTKEASDKSIYLRDLENQGTRLIPTLWFTQKQKISFNDIIKNTQWSDFVIKPTISSKSWNTHRISRQANGKYKVTSSQGILLDTHPEKILDQMLTSHDVCIQKFMPEILTSGELSFVFMGGCYSHTVAKTVSANGWIAHEFFGGGNQSIEADENDIQWATAIYDNLISQYGDLMYARIDGIRGNNKQIFLLECELLVPRLFLSEANKLDQYIDTIESTIKYPDNCKFV